MAPLSTAIRATHLVTNAAWFGGTVFGASSFNPAARQVDRTSEKVEVSDEGWRRWGPIQGAAIGLHLLSGLGIVADNRRRVALHRPTRNAVIAKTALTGAALVSTAVAWKAGERVGELQAPAHVEGGAAEVPAAPAERQRELSAALTQVKWAQWATPALTGALLVLDAYLGEQQRGPAGLLDGSWD